MASVCFFIISCEESSPEIPIYEMSPVSKYERDETTTLMIHNGKKITGYEVYERSLDENLLKYKADVIYKTGSIFCTLDGINYLIQFDNTIGGSRVRELSASIGNALYYKVIYFYDDQGRLSSTEINVAHEGNSIYYTKYEYSESSIKIVDDTTYEIQLGNEENTGYVYNVLGNSAASLTSKYVFNPELYFLNIYGKPVGKLPLGATITRSANSMRIGRYYYEYN
jgi:hypothetical protein